MTKQALADLALFGGQPAFDQKLHVGRPNIAGRDAFLSRVNDILDRRWLTNEGRYVQELETRLAEFIGVKHCIAMCNGTVALEIAIRALGLRGEVIVPAFTFIATAHALQWQEITPVFADVDPRTHTLNPAQVERMITPRTSGIIGVHLWGRACDVEGLADVARRYGLRLLFDAAHAFACTHRGRRIGSFGDAEIFSFHATKFFNTLEGGAVLTNNDDLAHKIRLMKNFGFAGYDNVIYIGTNGKMNEVSAAMGLTLLENLDDLLAVNRRNYLRYRAELETIPGLTLLNYPDAETYNYQYIVLEVDERTTGLSRDRLLSILWAENVIARRYFFPGCHRMEPYRSHFPHAGLLLPETERLVSRILLLPTGTAIEPDDIRRIGEILRLAVAHGPEISDRLHGIPLDPRLEAANVAAQLSRR